MQKKEGNWKSRSCTILERRANQNQKAKQNQKATRCDGRHKAFPRLVKCPWTNCCGNFAVSVVKHGVCELQPGWASQLLPHGLYGAKKSTRSKSNPTEVGERLEEVQMPKQRDPRRKSQGKGGTTGS